jgi:hypothetical protein
MSDVVIVPKLLLERLIETIECNDPRNEFLGQLRAELAVNEKLMADSTDIMHRNHNESPGPSYHEYDRDNRRWILMGEFDIDAMKFMTRYIANPPPKEEIIVPWSVVGGPFDDQ